MDTNKNVQPNALGVLTNDRSAKIIDKAELADICKLIPIQKFQKFQKFSKDEHNWINMVFSEQFFQDAKVERDEVTEAMDRYSDIRPYKYNVVTLNDKPKPSKFETYINADYIYHIHDKSKTAPAFIGTQGPIPETYNHFWRMMWQENSKSVVMLCGLTENGHLMCDVYWPEGKPGCSQVYDYLKVTNTGSKKISDFYWIRSFDVTNQNTNETRKITQYHAVGWPDRKVPAVEFTDSFEELLNIIVAEKDASPQPVVVHCSAGVGRTGTFFALYFLNWMLNYYKSQGQLETAALTIWGTVRALREQRMMMVQSNEQYEYLYSFMNRLIKKALAK